MIKRIELAKLTQSRMDFYFDMQFSFKESTSTWWLTLI